MAYNLTFYRDLSSAYEGLQTKDNNAFYYTIDDNNAFIGSHQLNNDALNVNDISLATKSSSSIVTISGIKEIDGKIVKSTDNTKDISFAKVAITGEAEDVSYSNTIGDVPVINIKEALDALNNSLSDGVNSKTVYVTENSVNPDYTTVYNIYQGDTGSAVAPEAAELIGTINIPKDQFVESAALVTIVFNDIDNKLYDGNVDVTTAIVGENTPTAANAGQYFKLTFAVASGSKGKSTIYISAKSLVNIYTSGSIATDEIVIGVDSNTYQVVANVGTNGIPAVKIKITDTNGYFTATDVENALTEIVEKINTMDAVVDATKTAIDSSTPRVLSNEDGIFALQSVTEENGVFTNMGVAEVAQIGSGTGRSGSGTEQDPYVYDDTIKGIKKALEDKIAGVTAIVDDLNVIEFPLASQNGSIVTIQGISEVDGKINPGVNPVNNIVLNGLAITAQAEDTMISSSTSSKFEEDVDEVDSALSQITEVLTWGTLGPPPDPAHTLKFSSDGPFTLSVSNPGWDGTLEYSNNYGKAWNTWDGSSLEGTSTRPIYLRGSNNTVISGYDDSYFKWSFTGKYIEGNIETLLDYQTVDNGQHPTMADNCYRGIFYGCSSLVQAPELPAIILTNYCYKNMFYGCTSLIKIPEVLPAITLTTQCYANMFYNCTSLVQTPELPATTLADNCYESMFDSCTSLVKTPEMLPATTLAYRCYASMFMACSLLTQAPKLPATTLADSCYTNMFGACSSLITPPELPAITLDTGCYMNMFVGCTSLIQLPELPATNIAARSYMNMFAKCTNIKLSETQTVKYSYEYRIPTTGTGMIGSLALNNMFAQTGGTFKGTPTINTIYYTDHKWAGYDEWVKTHSLKFSSDEPFTLSASKAWDGTLEYSSNDGETWTTWDGSKINGTSTQPIYLRGSNNTVITNGRAWNFTGKYCTGNIDTLLDYQTVINGQHPALANSCYLGMFSDCTSLTIAPALPATTLADYCYSSMFTGCTSLTTAPELSATTLAKDCCYYMFNGCTSLITPPELPATTLADRCYFGMFKDCTSLIITPELPATTLADYCYNSMFEGCSSLAQAPKLPATTLVSNCYNSMFRNCRSLTTPPELPATTLTEKCYNYMFRSCTSLKISTTQTGEYQYLYRIPTSGTGTIGTDSLRLMFGSTGGTFTSTPSINTTYYTDHEPV